MVEQKRWLAMTEKERASANTKMARFTATVDSRNPESRPLAGVIRLVDEFGSERRLYHHQVVAVQRLILKGFGTPWAQRKGSLIAFHDLGTGKTITGVLAIAVIRSVAPTLDAELSVVVCPKSMLHVWGDTLQTWTTYGAQIVVAEKQTDITEAVLDTAKVIVITPGVLKAAWYSFMVAQGGSEAKKKVDRFVHGPKKTGDPLPPVHPLFHRARARDAFSAVIVDELHTVCDPNNHSGHVVGLLCRSAVYTLGLTATPVSSEPKQVAHLAKTLNAQPAWTHEARHYTIASSAPRKRKRPVPQVARGEAPRSTGSETVNRATIELFHKLLVDRVDSSFIDLPPKVHTTVEFDPFIGRQLGGACNMEVLVKHNTLVEDAWRTMREAETGVRKPEDAGKAQCQAWQCIVALGHFEFDATLGMHGAKAFERDPTLYDRSLIDASEYVKLVGRMLMDRQRAGHARVAIFGKEVTELTILKRHLERSSKTFGTFFFYDGQLSATRRRQVVHDFLACERGVLLLTEAGAIGTTLCPGCEVLFCVGSVPWNSTTLEQAHGRVHRIGQTEPVEIVQFVPRRSVSVAKLSLHCDKRERLSRAVKDMDYSKFVETDKDRWRLQLKILKDTRKLDRYGNYAYTTEEKVAKKAWLECCERCDANGVARPAAPRNVPASACLADHIALPRAPFGRYEGETA
jgi:superfamily II DNA or RNA helicase